MNQNRHIVLVVDDNASIILNIKHLLIEEPYDLLTATSGKKAVALAEKHNPDLVLLDVMMPGIDGFSVCKLLRERENTANTPIVMLTALDDITSRVKGLDSGADDFITKPFDADELKAKVRTILRLDRVRRIQSAQDRFNWVIETANTGFVITDKLGAINYVNLSAKQMLEIDDFEENQTFIEIAQKNCTLRPEHLWNSWPEPLPTSETERRLIIRPQTKFSPALVLEVNVKQHDNDPDEQRIIRLRDVTKAMESQQNVWTFHRFVSHKLRSPMNSLYAGIEMLHDSPDMFEPDEVQEIIGMSYESLVQLKDEIGAIERYLDVSRSSELDEPASSCEIEVLLDKARQVVGIEKLTFRADANAKRFDIAMSGSALTLILAELMENAKKFHPTCDPTIHIEVIRQHDFNLRICFQDDGVHLPQTVLEKVWQPYFQAEGRFTGEISGMGLGLAMVSSLVWRAGGSCVMQNRPDQPGIMVEIDIPAL